MDKNELLELRHKIQERIASNLRESGIINYSEWYSSESISEKDIDEIFDNFAKQEKRDG